MNSNSELIAVVGGGPAGALAAERLARGGRRVLLVEEKLDWEKPCGGGVTHKALLRYPFLAEARVERNWVARCELISPAGRRVQVSLDRNIAVFSRRVLNRLMRERAQEAGAELLNDRVTRIEGRAGQWRMRTRDGREIEAAFLVIATGARNPFRAQFSTPFAPEMMVASGYYIPGSSHLMQIQFLPGLEGYVWVFPRSDHLSAGICGHRNNGMTSMDLRRRLEGFLAAEGFDLNGARFYSHLLPAPTIATLTQAPVCGEGWAMVGDAAGFVDPITGEGLYYAFRSAELLTDALLAENPAAYRALLAQLLLPELIAAARYTDRFFHGAFFGRPLLERMVQLVSGSKRFRAIVSDLFSGAQPYASLRKRCYRQMLPALWETLRR
jgi:geranylgeranyl reductase family protein